MRESIVFENNLDTQVGRWVEFAVPKQDRNGDIAEIGGSKARQILEVSLSSETSSYVREEIVATLER